MSRPRFNAVLAAICLALMPACSQAGEATKQNAEAPASTNAPAAQRGAGDQAASQVIGKKDFTLRGAPACEVRFVYAGREAENLFWEEPCAALVARMVTQRELEAFGKWDRLDSFARRFVNALPGGKVLYVEGSFSASIYPVGTTGSTYEVPVAD